ncbi:LOW QUALITY PROTEIN: kinesin-like protein KIN-12E [Salvia miltiorrhiza]|uniref:LOW QUALITY PROTEIN: kinesin-like protein KIN-12E n=1 Tax=Salvia miltiorrhiza TaxID=226208 RepID=UPI0025AC621F|nr:LOW QUALITY PROTEIN: kinesin-like protein KIN-12E [Salvia miltiorrhiza]
MSPIRRRTAQSAGDENEFESIWNQTMLVPSRPPLNSIPDPSQYQSQLSQLHFEEKPESSRRRKHEGVGERQVISAFMRTPKANGRAKPASSEPNSAQSTPARSGHRVSFAGSTLTRLPSQFSNGGGRAGLLHRDSNSRRFSIATPQQLLADVPHFELDDDPSFWNDHNVQVLIRMRPLNSSEMVSQGYGRCLRQESPHTVVWQGHPETRFTFDHIACESISQEKLFKVAGLPMVDNCMSGYNSCMFAYGQTGSGKTYTMMGDIDKMDGRLGEDCGITPRIFEYLFSRIKKEEESRLQERLTYSCKCSFLEIYNEHITDLLEPSSTNLQLREDLKKGVYVENLSEHSVRTVNDVLHILQQGAANRKIAATYMNSESSRSHSVFTCVIESRWEKDSMAHLRFGRLNLVDLAGSERQKSSGAEGDRLKEAANINKSLSTLGLVIMSLVDLAQGKHRHVPYRDSRLTFLLQDSLGGNSKTTIIANVSPSICSANETLSTLKFAQRAKLIQNNAKINEDASAGVIALQHQIQQLKDQLSFLMKNQNNPMELRDIVPGTEQRLGYFSEVRKPTKEINVRDVCETQKGELTKNKYLKATLHSALRREKLAETEIRSLKVEIEHLNRLAHQQQEETQRTKMMLKLREDKIKRLEFLSDGLTSADKFYLDENSALREENQLLQAKIGEHPEVIRFARENIRLLEQIRLFQEFYEQGERETLLAEISELRNQLLESLEVRKGHIHHQFSPMKKDQEPQVTKELELCKHMNSKLLREVDELQQRLLNRRDSSQDTFNSMGNLSLGNDSVDEVTSKSLHKNEVIDGKNDEKDCRLKNQCEDLEKQLMDAQALIETMKLEQFQLLKELETIQTENQSLMNMLERNQCLHDSIEETEGTSILALQDKLEKLTKELKEAKILNKQHIEDHAMQSSEHHQTELVRSEVEMETTRTIIHLQEEIDRLQSEFKVCLCSMTEENLSLRNSVAAKEEELRVFCAEWERAILELTTFLIDGSRSLRNASHQIKNISSSFPNVNGWINEHVERAAQVSVEKEETILLLQKSLEDAQNTVRHIEDKLCSLRGAAIALTELQWPENTSETEEIQMSRMPNESTQVEEFPKNRSPSRKSQAVYCSTSTSGVMGGGLDQPTSGRTEACINIFGELAVEDKHSLPNSFFAKCEEAFAAMKEADHTLKAMLKANGNANTLTTMWKEAAEELLSNSASLSDEPEQLKSCVFMGDGEKEVLKNTVQFSLNEKDCMLTFLEESFPAMQIEVEKLFGTTCNDAKKVVEETLAFFGSFRLSLEDLMCKALGNDITILVLQLQIGEYSKKFKSTTSNSLRSILQEHSLAYDNLKQDHVSFVRNPVLQPVNYGCEGSQVACVSREEIKEFELVDGDTLDEHSKLQRELQHKDVLLKGLLFDFSLLQEFASDRKDIKDELEKLIVAMRNVQQELQVKIIELNDILVQKFKLEDHLSEAEQDLFDSNSELSRAKGTIDVLSEKNIALKDLSQDLYLKNSETEQQLEDQRKAIQSLEKEIVRLSSLQEIQPVWSMEDYEGALTEMTTERQLLLEKLNSLQDKLDIASALADENQAIAVEARQESETSKLNAEQKEEEVKILERSVEELESTINVLEKKVLEMEEDVEQQRLIRDSLELEIQELRDRLLTVEDLTESMTSESSCSAVFEEQRSRKLHHRSLEINETRSRIRFLEEENAKQAKEIRQFKDYISELILHAEAQASQYQKRYKTLEAMVDEVKTDVANVSAGQVSERGDKITGRTRGSSSPFRCISTLVQQMNQEKDQELSSANLRIEELEALAACRYKEVCSLNTKLASAESMTHDVIRDLLSVKLDISNYATIIEQHQLQKLIEEAHQHRQDFAAMEREIVNLKSKIHELHEERERCISEINKNNADQLTIQIAFEQLQERDQMLIAQNDMLKMDKSNLQKRVAELDDMVRKLFSMQESQPQSWNQPRNSSFSRSFGFDLSERLANSQKVLSRVNNQLAQYRRPDGTSPDANVHANNQLKGCRSRYHNHL